MSKIRRKKSRLKKQLKMVTTNLNNEFAKIPKNAKREIIKTAFDIQADAMVDTPVVTGNLRGSSYVMYDGANPSSDIRNNPEENQRFSESVKKAESKVKSSKSRKIMAIVGYSASYALVVHGNPNAGRSGIEGASTVGSWLFLVKALHKNKIKLRQRLKRGSLA